MTTIRAAERPGDDEAIWSIFHAVVQEGETFSFPAETPRAEALRFWLTPPSRGYVAVADGQVVGSSYIKPNQPGRGSHVANAGFMVSPSARGQGVGRSLGEHALAEARRLGFRAMQFNYVVSSNTAAVDLWRSLGFQIVATLPGAFVHPRLGYVDVFVMFQEF